MTTKEYAEEELRRIMKDTDDSDGLQALINKDILEICEVFDKQGHSGFSASYAISIIERVLRYLPITPLTGEDDEWFALVGCDDGTLQNKRCSSVIKNPDGTIVDIDGYTVSDNGGITWFSSGKFQKQVTMPYTPPLRSERVYIEYTEDVPLGEIGDKYEVITDKPERIKALRERMSKRFE